MQLHDTAPTSTVHLTSRRGALRRTMPVAPATAIIAMCGFLVSSTPALAQSGEGRCSNRTLSGDYGFTITGDILLPGGARIPVRTLSMQQFDGAGNMTGVDHAVVNGEAPTDEWRVISGTYSVNPDCTGKGQVVFGPGAFLDYYLVVVDKGREIHEVINGNAVTTVGIRVK